MDNRPILLILDNESDIELTRRAFRKIKIVNRLMVVEDGQDALDYLWGNAIHRGRDTSKLPALILLDLKLSGISGLEVLRRIRAAPRTRRIAIVSLTSSKEEQDLAAGYDLGVNSYIRKPVDFKQFVAAAEHIGIYWPVLNEPPPEIRRLQ